MTIRAIRAGFFALSASRFLEDFANVAVSKVTTIMEMLILSSYFEYFPFTIAYMKPEPSPGARLITDGISVGMIIGQNFWNLENTGGRIFHIRRYSISQPASSYTRNAECYYYICEILTYYNETV